MSVWRNEFSRPHGSREWFLTGLRNYEEPRVFLIEHVPLRFDRWDYEWILLIESRIALGFRKVPRAGRDYIAMFTEQEIEGQKET
jgi:hypothetical protein